MTLRNVAARNRLRMRAVECVAKGVRVGRGFVAIVVGIGVVMSTTSVAALTMVSILRIVLPRLRTASPAKNSGATLNARVVP